MTINQKNPSAIHGAADRSLARPKHRRQAWATPSITILDLAQLTLGGASGPSDGIVVES